LIDHDGMLHYRKAEIEEMDWAYQLFKLNLQRFIADTWGWNEIFQRHSFMANLPASSFVIASLADEDIGGYCLMPKQDHFYLEMLLLAPQHQGRGHGSRMMQQVLAQSAEHGLPVLLSVLKNNPAHQFYRKLGFEVYAEDSFRYKMRFPHPGTSR
jgi:ribosomal protein S18 acetylase RimI-like enzyme